MNKVVVFVVIIVVGIIGVATWLLAKPPETDGSSSLGKKYAAFAQCLADKKVVMYGAEWCPHCQKQKANFGVDAFKYVTYVECPDNPKVCLDKKIKGYPTWIFPNGHRLEGEQAFEKLSKESSCSLPRN